MLFRKATEKDLQAVAEIYSDIHTAEEAGNVTIGWVRDVYPTAKTAALSLRRGDLIVAEEDGVIVGTAIINQLQVDVYENAGWQYEAPNAEVMVLHTLVISPKAARKGYGTAFVKFYEEYALSQGCPYLRMDTNARNTQARALYRKLGYREIGIVPCVFNGIDGVQLVLLEKRLPGIAFTEEAMITIQPFEERDTDGIIELVLHCQNDGTRPPVTVDDQPDLRHITAEYIAAGGNFWVAKDNGKIAGTIALKPYGDGMAILKKFFVYEPYRGAPHHLGQRLYGELLAFAAEKGFRQIFLDTPKNTVRAHKFYEKAGFLQIPEEQMPFTYHYPIKDCDFFCLDLHKGGNVHGKENK